MKPKRWKNRGRSGMNVPRCISEQLWEDRPNIDNLSTFYMETLSICCIDKSLLSMQHKDNLSICVIYKLSLSGIDEHNFI